MKMQAFCGTSRFIWEIPGQGDDTTGFVFEQQNECQSPDYASGVEFLHGYFNIPTWMKVETINQ